MAPAVDFGNADDGFIRSRHASGENVPHMRLIQFSGRVPHVVGGASLGVVLGVAFVSVGWLRHIDGTGQLGSSVQALGVGLFLAAGVLCLAGWRIAGGAPSALLGAALILRGAGAAPLTILDGHPLPGASVGYQAEVAMAIVVAVVAVVVTAALASDALDELVRPVRIIAVGMVVVLAGAGIIGLAGRFSAHVFAATPTSLMVLDLTVSAVWAAVALLAWRRRRLHAWAVQIAPLLLGMACVGALRATAARSNGSMLPARLVVVVVAVAAVALALRQVLQAVMTEHTQFETAVEALTRAEALVAERDDWREELGHDAVNSLAGLRAAVTTLTRLDGRLDGATVGRLQHAVLGELSHLEHLVRRADDDHCRPFELKNVVEAVVATRQAAGLRVVLRGAEGEADGRSGDLSTVMHNLLVNAERHAAGTLVEVEVGRVEDRFEISVSDEGPGIPPYLASTVFDRGVRGPHSPGSGLGLHVARQLMRDQGGDLELRERTGGCTFVVIMPAARPARPPAVRGAIPRPRRSPAAIAPAEPVSSRGGAR